MEIVMNRKQILNNFIENIHGISDKEYQKRVWVRGEGPECDDFTETICHFFDDGDPILKKYKEYSITKKQYKLLCKLRNLIESFLDTVPEIVHEETEILPNPKWHKIQKMAKEVLEVFNYKKEA